MSRTLKLNFPNKAEGELIDVNGLGTYENGKSYDIEDWQVENWATVQRGLGLDDTWEAGYTLELPEPPPDEITVTGTQSEGELQRQILEYQEGRTEEEALQDEVDGTIEYMKGNVNWKPSAEVPSTEEVLDERVDVTEEVVVQPSEDVIDDEKGGSK
jgi:hypothetical protein